MKPIEELDRIAITVKSHRLLKTLVHENPKLEEILRNSKNEIEARVGIKNWVLEELGDLLAGGGSLRPPGFHALALDGDELL